VHSLNRKRLPFFYLTIFHDLVTWLFVNGKFVVDGASFVTTYKLILPLEDYLTGCETASPPHRKMGVSMTDH
jgi:hypothetical protein